MSYVNLADRNWTEYRDEANNLAALAEEMFKQGGVKHARATYREAADRALLALYAAPSDDKDAREKLGQLIQSLCEKMEHPEPKQKTAA